jgi:hypothetical protein
MHPRRVQGRLSSSSPPEAFQLVVIRLAMDGPDLGERPTVFYRELNWLPTQTRILRDHPETAFIVCGELEDSVAHQGKVLYLTIMSDFNGV